VFAFSCDFTRSQACAWRVVSTAAGGRNKIPNGVQSGPCADTGGSVEADARGIAHAGVQREPAPLRRKLRAGNLREGPADAR
jgi:hypothetical protein